MPIALRSWWDRTVVRRGRGRRARRPRLEWLENRILFASDTLATATPLNFTAFETAHVAGFLASPTQKDLYEVHLNRGDRITAAVSALEAGSGLQSLLRVLDSAGKPRALDDQLGGDPRLTFQASVTGDYFVGVSGASNSPRAATGIRPGRTTGQYGLDGALITAETKHYIHTVHEDAVRTTEITGNLSHLYELQGLPTIRSESYSHD